MLLSSLIAVKLLLVGFIRLKKFGNLLSSSSFVDYEKRNWSDRLKDMSHTRREVRRSRCRMESHYPLYLLSASWLTWGKNLLCWTGSFIDLASDFKLELLKGLISETKITEEGFISSITICIIWYLLEIIVWMKVKVWLELSAQYWAVKKFKGQLLCH